MRDYININSQVRFRLADVFNQTPHELLEAATQDLIIEGVVVAFSDSGDKRKAFAVVQVRGIEGPVIVPWNKLHLLDTSSNRL